MSAIVQRDPFEISDLGYERSLAPLADDPQEPRLERWLGRGLLALAVLLVLVVDVRIARNAPHYQAGVEAFNVAYAEQVAELGTPPVLGKDTFVIDPARNALPARAVAIRDLDPPVKPAAPIVAANTPYPQGLALERPGAYYVVAPVSWIVPWEYRVLALRLICVLLTCLSVGFLWAAVREAWPANPLAAGLASIVLATMGGLVSAFALFQPEALLLALWCAGLWLAVRDGRRRRCGWPTVLVWAAATCVGSVAVPAAVAVVAFLVAREHGGSALARRLPLRLGATLVPTVVWVAWNWHAYGDLWPLDTVVGAPDRPRDWHQLRAVLDQVFGVNRVIFDGIYTAGLAPLTRHALVPAGIIGLALALALLAALVGGRIAVARRPLARVGSLLLGSFLSIYLTLFLSSIVAGAQVDYGASHFGGFVASWAAVVGVGVTAPFGRRRWPAIAVVGILTMVLAVVMLRTPVA